MLLTDEDLVILTAQVYRFECAISECKLVINTIRQGKIIAPAAELMIREQEKEIEHLEARLAPVKTQLSRMLFGHIQN